VSAIELPTLIDIPTVAEHLGTSIRHVRRLVAERRIPHHKIGGLIRFDPEITAWVAAGARPSQR